MPKKELQSVSSDEVDQGDVLDNLVLSAPSVDDVDAEVEAAAGVDNVVTVEKPVVEAPVVEEVPSPVVADVPVVAPVVAADVDDDLEELVACVNAADPPCVIVLRNPADVSRVSKITEGMKGTYAIRVSEKQELRALWRRL